MSVFFIDKKAYNQLHRDPDFQGVDLVVVKKWDVSVTAQNIIDYLEEKGGLLPETIEKINNIVVAGYNMPEGFDSDVVLALRDTITDEELYQVLVDHLFFESIPSNYKASSILISYTYSSAFVEELQELSFQEEFSDITDIVDTVADLAEDKKVKQTVKKLRKVSKKKQPKKKKAKKKTAQKYDVYLLPQHSYLNGRLFNYQTFIIEDSYDNIIYNLRLRKGTFKSLSETATYAIITPYQNKFVVVIPEVTDKKLLSDHKISVPFMYFLTKEESESAKGYIIVEKSHSSAASAYDMTFISKVGDYVVYFDIAYKLSTSNPFTSIDEYLANLPSQNIEIVLTDPQSRSAIANALQSKNTPPQLKGATVKMLDDYDGIILKESSVSTTFDKPYLASDVPSFKKVGKFDLKTFIYSDAVYSDTISALKSAIVILLVAGIMSGFSFAADNVRTRLDQYKSYLSQQYYAVQQSPVVQNINELQQYLQTVNFDQSTSIVIKRMYELFGTNLRRLVYSPKDKEIIIELSTISGLSPTDYIMTLMKSDIVDYIQPPKTLSSGEGTIRLMIKLK